MINTIFTKTFDAPQFNRGEILRYAGTKEVASETEMLLEECLAEVKNILTYKVCYGQFPLSFCDDAIDLSFVKTKSKKLRKNLDGCGTFILFAATVGIETDRLIAKYGKISPSKALMFQAIGTERIESLCDAFNAFITAEFGHTKPRFSPGYGDLPLEIQQDFFRVLEPSRKIGLTLNDSMLMSPSKSVTAIIGISDIKCEDKKENCNSCEKADCQYRKP